MSQATPKYAPESPENDFDYWLVRFNMEVSQDLILGTNVLELGCFAGFSTSLLLARSQKLTVVDLSQENIDLTRRKMADHSDRVTLICSAWEKFEPRETFSDAVMWRGLEHVVDPVPLLRRIGSWLSPGGRLHIVVPNAQSLHRRVGVAMGMMSDVHELNARDHEVGHQRVYDRALLTRHLADAGLRVHRWDGVYLKPLSNGQMQKWDESLIRAFFKVGRELPDYCAEIYICATKATD
ncbi:MAG: methyltransferase domain-containing protein [Candidatus Zixiibacteriota bacterium]